MKALGEEADRQPKIQQLSDQGSGRSFIFVLDDAAYAMLACAVAKTISERNRCVVLRTVPVSGKTWAELSILLHALLKSLAIRQASFVCFGAGATLVQNLVLEEPKIVRSLVLVDASSRPHPTRWDRIVDSVENVLPLGLPLRLGLGGFNVRSYLHRLRCPLLVVTTKRAGGVLREDADTVAMRAPTAWRINIGSNDGINEVCGTEGCRNDVANEETELGNVIMSFQDTPAKCPQKNLKD